MTVIPATWTRPAALAAAVLAGAAAPVAAKEPIEIGMAVAMTGYLANYDGQFVEGAKLAAKRANDHGGIDGHPVELHALDDASNATTGVTITNQLLNQYNVSVMLNGLSSAQNGAIEPILARAKVPQIHISECRRTRSGRSRPTSRTQGLRPRARLCGAGAPRQKGRDPLSRTRPMARSAPRFLARRGGQRCGLTVVYSDGDRAVGDRHDAAIGQAQGRPRPDVVIDVLTGSTHIVEAKAAATVGLRGADPDGGRRHADLSQGGGGVSGHGLRRRAVPGLSLHSRS